MHQCIKCPLSHNLPRRCAPNSSADILSAVSFDQSGEYFATGDRGGRVVIFKKGDGGKAKVKTCFTVLVLVSYVPVLTSARRSDIPRHLRKCYVTLYMIRMNILCGYKIFGPCC